MLVGVGCGCGCVVCVLNSVSSVYACLGARLAVHVVWVVGWVSVFCLVGIACFFGGFFLIVLFGEFDPGSGRTLAACLTHASRTGSIFLRVGGESGERVSNT